MIKRFNSLPLIQSQTIRFKVFQSEVTRPSKEAAKDKKLSDRRANGFDTLTRGRYSRLCIRMYTVYNCITIIYVYFNYLQTGIPSLAQPPTRILSPEAKPGWAAAVDSTVVGNSAGPRCIDASQDTLLVSPVQSIHAHS